MESKRSDPAGVRGRHDPLRWGPCVHRTGGAALSPAKARRAYGSGSVWQRGDGRWYGVIEAGYTSTGGRRRVTVSAKTEAECKRRLKEKQRQVAAEGVSDASARTTVKAWSEQWLELTKHTLRPKPWATDRSAVRQWIVPTIGHKRLEQLTPADVRAVANAQRAAGRSTSTAHRTHTTLTSMLRAARQEGHQVPPRVLEVKAPALAVHDRTDMPVVEALAILREASYLPHGSRWAMAFLHGARQGECLGLTEESLDLDAGLVTVEWQLQTLPYNIPRDRNSGFRIPDGYEARHLSGTYHLVRPKTRKGFRVAPMVPAMCEAIADWLAVRPANPWGLIWPAADGMPADAKDDREEWYGLQGAAGVGHPAGRFYYLHEARHTTGQALLEERIDEGQATAIMGHSSIITTRGYQHPSQAVALEAMKAIASRFGVG